MSAFARQRTFWTITGWAAVFGLVMGAVGIGWLGLVEKLPETLCGTIFPMLFIGGTLGMTLHAIIPGIPAGLAVPAAMAAVPGAAVAIPFSLIAIVAFAVTVDAANVAPIGIAVLTSYLLVMGTGLAGRARSSA